MDNEADKYKIGDTVWYVNNFAQGRVSGIITGMGFKHGTRVYDVDCDGDHRWGYEDQFSKR